MITIGLYIKYNSKFLNCIKARDVALKKKIRRSELKKIRNSKKQRHATPLS